MVDISMHNAGITLSATGVPLIMTTTGGCHTAQAAGSSTAKLTTRSTGTRGEVLDTTAELQRFLAGSERRAYRIAVIATGNREEALDILQDAMTRLVEKYADRDSEEWGPLFHTILQSRIKDWYRRNSVRNRFRAWFGSSTDNEDDYDPVQSAADPAGRSPEQLTATGESMAALEAAIRQLPLRQQQAFVLRALQGFDVAETAGAMSCSQGSVKTHYSRAVHTLRDRLGEYRL